MPTCRRAPRSSTRTRTSATTSTACAAGRTSCCRSWTAYGISQAFTFCMDEPDRHPAFSAANDRTRAWTEETGGRLIPFVRLDLAESPDRGGRALPRPRRARHQAPSPGAGLPAHGRAPGAGVRARGRAARADPHPRRPRAAADLGRPREARRPAPGGGADHRPRGDRRHGRARPRLRLARRRLLRHVGLEPGRPARLLPPGLARAGALRLRLPVRAAAELAADRRPDGARRRLRRAAAARHALRKRRAHRRSASRRSSPRRRAARTSSRSR